MQLIFPFCPFCKTLPQEAPRSSRLVWTVIKNFHHWSLRIPPLFFFHFIPTASRSLSIALFWFHPPTSCLPKVQRNESIIPRFPPSILKTSTLTRPSWWSLITSFWRSAMRKSMSQTSLSVKHYQFASLCLSFALGEVRNFEAGFSHRRKSDMVAKISLKLSKEHQWVSEIFRYLFAELSLIWLFSHCLQTLVGDVWRFICECISAIEMYYHANDILNFHYINILHTREVSFCIYHFLSECSVELTAIIKFVRLCRVTESKIIIHEMQVKIDFNLNHANKNFTSLMIFFSPNLAGLPRSLFTTRALLTDCIERGLK